MRRSRCRYRPRSRGRGRTTEAADVVEASGTIPSANFGRKLARAGVAGVVGTGVASRVGREDESMAFLAHEHRVENWLVLIGTIVADVKVARLAIVATDVAMLSLFA